MKKKHALCGASSSHIWLHCPFSPVLSARIGRQETKDTLDGTVAHELAEKYIQKKGLEDIPAFAKEVFSGLSDDEQDEMLEAVSRYREALDYIKDRVAKSGGTWGKEYVELPIQLNELIWGTSDYCATYTDKNGKACGLIVDFKYGKGKKVEVQNNPQLACYAVAFRNTIGADLEKVVVSIVQPRIESSSDEDGNPFFWSISKEELKEWEEKLERGCEEVYKALAGDPEVKVSPGSWCQFCRGGAICKAAFKEVDEVRGLSLLNKNMPIIPEGVETLSLEDISRLLTYKDNITAFFKKAENHIFNLISSGKSVPGWKLIKGRSVRKWIDDEEYVIEELQRLGVKNLFTKKLIAITNVAKEISSNKFKHLVVKPEGNLKLVPECAEGVEVLFEDAQEQLDSYRNKKALDLLGDL